MWNARQNLISATSTSVPACPMDSRSPKSRSRWQKRTAFSMDLMTIWLGAGFVPLRSFCLETHFHQIRHSR